MISPDHRGLVMKKLIIALLVLWCAQLDFAHGNQAKFVKTLTPDLSGAWKLNRAKSDLGDDNRYELSLNEVGITILHHDPDLNLTRRFRAAKSDTESKWLFHTNGSGETNPGITAREVIKSNTKWEGKKLVSRYLLHREIAWSHGTVDSVDVVDEWSLSDDGKILTLKTTLRYMQRGTDAEHSPPFKGYVPRLWLKRVYDRVP
jgi:hypothetical protein